MIIQRNCGQCGCKWEGEEKFAFKTNCPFCGAALSGIGGNIAVGATEKPLDLDDDNFLIVKGVLKEYRGEGGRVVVPKGVTVIGKNAFTLPNTTAIKSIALPEGILELKDGAFQGCGGVTALTLPLSLKKIGKDCFNGMGVKELIIPDNVTEIADKAFSMPESSVLSSVVLPKNFSRLGKIFASCWHLKSVKIPYGVETIEGGAFEYCFDLSAVEIPETVKKIKAGAFLDLRNLKKLFIPQSVTEIEAEAIPYFIHVYMERDSRPARFADRWHGDGSNTHWGYTRDGFQVKNDGIQSAPDTAVVNFPKGVKRIVSVRTARGMVEANVPEGVASIEAEAFRFLTKLKTVRLPKSLKSIGNGAFEECRSLWIVSMSDNLSSIGEKAFGGCTSLQAISLPKGLTSLGAGAFENCSNLTEIYIPENVTFVGANAFAGCNKKMVITVATKSQTKGWDKKWTGGWFKVKYIGR
ncbi:MAG: leucine-rich repeat domain-containing protein [Clostridia bacterium]|nr:leucine-rich repeat domain-containing protein [Clostridia bacterium]